MAPAYFNFARALMTYIGASFTFGDVETGGTDLIKSSFSKLVENEGLWEEFLRCGDMLIPVLIYIDLLKKTFHL